MFINENLSSAFGHSLISPRFALFFSFVCFDFFWFWLLDFLFVLSVDLEMSGMRRTVGETPKLGNKRLQFF